MKLKTLKSFVRVEEHEVETKCRKMRYAVVDTNGSPDIVIALFSDRGYAETFMFNTSMTMEVREIVK